MKKILTVLLVAASLFCGKVVAIEDTLQCGSIKEKVEKVSTFSLSELESFDMLAKQCAEPSYRRYKRDTEFLAKIDAALVGVPNDKEIKALHTEVVMRANADFNVVRTFFRMHLVFETAIEKKEREVMNDRLQLISH